MYFRLAEGKGKVDNKDPKKRKSSAATPDLKGAKKSKSDDKKASGFDRGLEPEKIIGKLILVFFDSLP